MKPRSWFQLNYGTHYETTELVSIKHQDFQTFVCHFINHQSVKKKKSNNHPHFQSNQPQKISTLGLFSKGEN